MKLASRRTVVSLNKRNVEVSKITRNVKVLTKKYIAPNSFGAVVPALQVKAITPFVAEVQVRGVAGSILTLKHGEYIFV